METSVLGLAQAAKRLDDFFSNKNNAAQITLLAQTEFLIDLVQNDNDLTDAEKSKKIEAIYLELGARSIVVKDSFKRKCREKFLRLTKDEEKFQIGTCGTWVHDTSHKPRKNTGFKYPY